MPFDGKITMTRLQKLERLRELLDEATDEEQPDCGRCLLNRMANDGVMRAAGFDAPPLPRGITRRQAEHVWSAAVAAGYRFLDLPHCNMFGGGRVELKRVVVERFIAAERARVE